MAIFNLRVAGPIGVQLTKKADGVVPFGRLLVTGSSAEDYIVTSKVSDEPIAVSFVDDRVAVENDAEQYNDNDPMVVEYLIPGQVLNLLANGAITANGKVVPSETGRVELYVATGNKMGINIGQATIADAARGPILITKMNQG